MSAPPIQVGQPLPGAILFVTVQRDKNGSYTPMIAYDPWAKGGDTIPTLKKRWGSNGPYRERLDKNVVWAGSPRGERYGKFKHSTIVLFSRGQVDAFGSATSEAYLPVQ